MARSMVGTTRTRRSRKTPSLQRVLSYRNRDVVDRFTQNYAVSFREASDIFTETKKWLWLNAVNDKTPIRLSIDDPLLVIDEMWHTFLVFTRAYATFCDEYLGVFIHHNPTTKRGRIGIRREHRRNPKEVVERRRRAAEAQYRFIYEKLGEQTLVKWYETYPERYPLTKMRKLCQIHKPLVE